MIALVALVAFLLGILAHDLASTRWNREFTTSKRPYDRRRFGEQYIPSGISPVGMTETYSSLGRRFPRLSFQQLTALLVRRAQERHHGENAS